MTARRHAPGPAGRGAGEAGRGTRAGPGGHQGRVAAPPRAATRPRPFPAPPAQVMTVLPLSTSNVTICRNPAPVPGAALVMSSRTRLLRTGSKLSVVGWSEAVARLIFRLRTGTNFAPFQYETVTEAGWASVALIVNEAATESNGCGDGQATDTQSPGLDTLTARRLAVPALS